MEHLISIIVPVFNVEDYIETCVNSILSQTYTKFEVILVNDGSTDKSGEICNQFALKDRRVKVIHQVNKGVSAARNSGIRVANGEYICFVDSDDKIQKDFLKGFELNYDISIQGYLLQEGENNFPISYKELLGFDNVAKVYCLNDIHSAPFSKLCKTEIINRNNIRFPEEISFSEDTIFFLQYIKYCKSIHISKSCNYVYYKREGSLTAKQYDVKILMKKEEILFSLYDDLFADETFKKRFFHEFSLFVLLKYYLNDFSNLEYFMTSFLGVIMGRYLKNYEKVLLRLDLFLFCQYALWRRRIKRKALRALLFRYNTTLLNI